MSRGLVNDTKNEELRVLFVLGLLAVLIAIKLQTPNGTFNVSIGELNVNAMPLLDLTVTLWSLYAFFMVLGLSEDIIGKSFSSGFREIAKTMLRMNFAILSIFGVLYGYLAYPTRLPWVIGLILILLLFGAIKLIQKKSKERKRWGKLNLKQNKETIIVFVLFVSIVLILYYPDDWIRLPAFILAVVSLIGYLSWHKEKRVQTPIEDDCAPN